MEMKNRGFTLIEMLVAVVITAVLMTVAGSSFFSMLRGATKTELIKEVKQNGDYAISIMDIKIRNARDVTSSCTLVGVTGNTLTITNPDNSQSTFACVTNSGVRRIQETITPVAGAPIANYITNSSVTIANNCNTPNLSFTCKIGSDGKSKSVNILFSLLQPGVVTAVDQYTQNFNAQISLRNN